MKTVFVVQGYTEISQIDQRLADVCTIEVFATNEVDAIEKAKAYIAKKFYRVSNIIEKD